MFKYFIQRIVWALPILFGISLIAFFVVRFVPGDTVTTLLGAHYNEEQAAFLREKLGLDRPVVVQYVIWMKGIFQGDFGESTFTSQPVLASIIERLPVTLELACISLLFAVCIGVPVGAIAAVKRNTFIDYLAGIWGMLGVSIPNFWFATLLVLLFSLKLGWLPSGNFVPLNTSVVDNLKSIIMPGFALGAAVSAVVMRMARSAMLEVLDQDYIEMARAKGVPPHLLVFKHALKNALVPILTVLGIQAGYLLGGSVVIEQVFSLPGIGRLALQAITNRDYALLQGTILFVATGFIVINLVVDLLYAFINPKVRF
jgi:peptide/nickel transport system permease protein